LQAVQDAKAAAQRELEAMESRDRNDRERIAAQKAKLQIFGAELALTRAKLLELEGSQNEATEASAKINEEITAHKTAQAALEAERDTAQAHIRDLEQLKTAMEGDREQKKALIAAIEQENTRLEGQIQGFLAQQRDNDEEADKMRTQMSQVLSQRAEAEAARTRSEREAQEKNKDILNLEKACALLEQKKITTALEERQIIDKLWDSYELTPGTAGAKRAPIESVASGNRRIGELKRKIAALGTPNLGAIEEYARVNERYTYLSTQYNDVLTSKRELESIIRNITQEMTVIFVEEFKKIDHFFGLTFQEMFGGGKGQLILENPAEPLTCGIEIRVQPPGKQVKTITLLSGGEKAFVAIALYFAILKVRPTPFCMLDEIDAALDDRNVERFATYLRSLSGKTQFIVITHRRGTMEASDVLYGVTMQEQGVSKLLRLDLNQMEQYLGIVE
jgi:chromosome segregation protein